MRSIDMYISPWLWFRYFTWLNVKYNWLAWYIIIYWVAPDEIALDWDLDRYYRYYIP